MRDAVRYVLFYDMGPAGAEMARQLYPAHQKWFEQFMRRGVLLSLGRSSTSGRKVYTGQSCWSAARRGGLKDHSGQLSDG